MALKIELVLFRWVPYTKAPNKCELNCMPRGERFYYRQKKQVIDGTPCDDERPDICVSGKCLVSSFLCAIKKYDNFSFS